MTDETKKEMKRVLDDIQSGRFTRDWMLENQAGTPSFKATRAIQAQHPIEEVGGKLRAILRYDDGGDGKIGAAGLRGPGHRGQNKGKCEQ